MRFHLLMNISSCRTKQNTQQHIAQNRILIVYILVGLKCIYNLPLSTAVLRQVSDVYKNQTFSAKGIVGGSPCLRHTRQRSTVYSVVFYFL